MQKKVLALLIVLSTNAYAATVDLGFENERYTSDEYKTSDAFMPYIATSFNPIDDSKFNISMKYMYQDQYGKKDAETQKDRFKTNRDRFEFFVKGYTWKNGDFSFSPSVGFRYEDWKINYENTGRQDSRKFELRFLPNMTYKINDQVSLYLSGFVAPVFVQTKQESRKDSSYVKGQLGTNNYNNDYYQELQLLGVKYKINGNNTVWSSIYNERKYTQYSSKYDRWQLRVGYDVKATSDLSFGPFVRYDLSYREENTENGNFAKDSGKTRSKDEVRIGSTASYEIMPSVSLLGEIYWQTAKVESYSGVSSEDKNRMFYKLAVRKAF
ncbi:hypothetical protein [Klebsiella sp. BIGb0407]|uniref:hypothetical protein n=1 Tax=Klebsiella sp. BIGb0407 TaxID=2940603 RepID=UPI002166C277|nr:hypothetical protein [Klebsiella sp. BIGb0407]MCS3431062.1 hypothetical protein [Klebsiella sp. BIGb0407]